MNVKVSIALVIVSECKVDPLKLLPSPLAMVRQP